MSSALDELKRGAAVFAVDAVRSGMVVGLGTGSTATYAVHEIAARLADGRLTDVVGVATSEGTARIARERGVPLAGLDERSELDLTIDGADEVDADLDLIKGLGGALLREKLVAYASRRVVIVIDAGKRVDRLGTNAPVPVEVVRFGWTAARSRLERSGARATLRSARSGEPFVTDEGHYIIDCRFGPIADKFRLAEEIRKEPGVVEHGLFLGIATRVIVASPRGIEELER